MHLLMVILLLAVGGCEAATWQKLMCPYELHHVGLLRVWCKESSADCCNGLTFSQSAHLVDEGKLVVTEGPDSFTVEMLEPSFGEGTYWCAVLNTNDTIIKLAEGYFYSSSALYIWSISRWILLPVLPMVTIFTNIYSRPRTKRICKKAEEPDDDAAVNRALESNRYMNAAHLCELE